MERSFSVELNVMMTEPAPYMPDVSVYTPIVLEFNQDVDTASVADNVKLYSCVDEVFKGVDSLGDLQHNVEVECSIGYKDRVLTLTPNNALKEDGLYIVHIPAHTVKSVLGSVTLTDYIGQFSTEGQASAGVPELTSPQLAGVVSNPLPIFTWTNTAGAYNIQISSFATFEKLLLDTVADSSQFQPEQLPLSEGRYYWRVRPLNGKSWSELGIFFVKDHVDAMVSHEDVIPTDPIMPWEDPFEILETYPIDGMSNLSLTLKTAYIKVKGLVTEGDVDFGQTGLVGELVDEDDLGTVEAHGNVPGTWVIVQDKEAMESYLVFTLKSLSGGE